MERERQSSGSAAQDVRTILSNSSIDRGFRKDCFMNLLDSYDCGEHPNVFESKVIEEFPLQFFSAIDIIE